MNDSYRNRFRPAGAHRFSGGAHTPAAFRWFMAVVATSLSAGILMAAVVPGWIGADGRTAAHAGGSAAVTEQSKAGATIYELPPISVVANRKAELAKIERDEKAETVREAARSRSGAKPRA